jgi:hypothetical protein
MDKKMEVDGRATVFAVKRFWLPWGFVSQHCVEDGEAAYRSRSRSALVQERGGMGT